MFRENPSLALLLLEQILHLPIPEHTSVAVVEAALDQLVPIEYRADLVIEVKQGDKVVFAIVLEVQLGEDPDKNATFGEALRGKVAEMIMNPAEEFELPFERELREMCEAKGRAEGLKAALLKLVTRVGLALGDEERARIDACDDPAVLDRWLDNAFGAKTAADLFQ